MSFTRPVLDLLEPIHTHTYRVIYADTDAGGVVYYGRYMRFFEIGRAEYMRTVLNIAYSALEKLGVVMPVVEMYCRYKAPARYDDLISISTSIYEYSKVSVRFHYEIKLAKGGKTLIKGYTVHAAVNKNGKLLSLPDELKQAMLTVDIGKKTL